MKTLINKLSLEGEISNFGVCQKRKRKSKTKKKLILLHHTIYGEF